MEASAFHDGTASRSTSPLRRARGNQASLGAPGGRGLAGRIIVNLLTVPRFYDVALRDFGLLLGALMLARLAWSYDTPLKRDRS